MITIKKNRLFEDILTTQLLSSTTGNITFEPAYIPDIADLQNVYDQYRVEKVKCTFIPKFNAAGSTVPANAGAVPFTGIFATAIDYDSAVAPSGINEVLNYPSAKWSRGTSLHTRVFTPKAQLFSTNAAGTGTLAYSTGSRNPWIDCTRVDTKHLGLKVCVEDSDTVVYNYDMVVEWTISFKNLH